MRFRNKTVLITGSSRGIGRATALHFAKEGANVVINYIKHANEANRTLEEIKKLGRDGLVIKADASIENDVKKMIDEVVRYFGGIDILVNNAGIVFDIPLLEKTVEQWERTLQVNLIGTFLCTKYAYLHMKDRVGAAIVNVSSNNGIDGPSPESADYDASKAGIISLTKNCARALAPIRVNSVAPGWIDTDINKNLPKDFIASELERTLLKRWGQPEEIAKGILFLCSEDASYITGTTLMIDGGYK